MFGGSEKRVLETGLEIYRQLKGEAPSVFKKEFWNGKIMDWCMKNEDFKVQMFRFVDVFPSLRDAKSVADHVDEYFCAPDLNFSSSIQWGLKLVSAGTISKNITSMAHQFIAGEDTASALPVLQKLREQGIGFTVDLLGEAVVSEKEAEQFFARYIDLLEVLDGAQGQWKALGGDETQDWGHAPRINVSIKPSALYSQMNPRAVTYSVKMAKERLRPIFRRGMQAGAHIILDMEHTALKNNTLELYRSLLEEDEFSQYPHTGIVIQAYLKESESDLNELIRWAKKRGQRITIRLVKGAYWDVETVWAKQQQWDIPVFTRKHETDANYEKLARIILQNHRYVSLACASHNIRTLAFVIEEARKLKVPAGALEFQGLYGMADALARVLAKMGFPVRLYTPIGAMLPGMAYLVRRLLENTANESFLRQSYAEKKAITELLRNPAELGSDECKTPSSLGASDYGEKDAFVNEPVFDWTIKQNRTAFVEAIERVRADGGRHYPLVIGGDDVVTTDEIISTDPNNPEERVGSVSAAGIKEAEAAVVAAVRAFPAWRDTDPRERAEYLFRAAAVARKRRRDLAALQVLEVGKNWSEADAEVTEGIDFLEYYGREMIRLAKPRRMGNAPGEVSRLFYEPRGVGAVIAPWNFPFAISLGMASAAIVTGNTVIYKPASQSPVTGAKVYEIFAEAGLPPGVLNFLPGPGGKIGEYLVTHPDVAMITFTGSMDVGLRIIQLAAQTPEGAQGVKNVVAEMGGKNAIIVDGDADLDEAVLHTLYSAFGYQGQKCSACSRVIVLDECYASFVERLAEAARSIGIAPVERPESYMGCVIDAKARSRILEYIEQGKKEGRLLVCRDDVNLPGHYAPLCIFEGIRPEHVLAQEEIFGPVLSVIRVKDFGEALEVANGTRYALTGGVFSRSPRNIARAMREFRVGNLYVNRGCTGAIVERHPFGGFKMSGVGSKAGGPDYLLQFMVPRAVTENTIRRGFAPSAEGDA